MATLLEQVQTCYEELRKCTEVLKSLHPPGGYQHLPKVLHHGDYAFKGFTTALLAHMFEMTMDRFLRKRPVQEKDGKRKTCDHTISLKAFRGNEAEVEELYRHAMELNAVFDGKRLPFEKCEEGQHVRPADAFEYEKWNEWLEEDNEHWCHCEVEWRCQAIVEAFMNFKDPKLEIPSEPKPTPAGILKKTVHFVDLE